MSFQPAHSPAWTSVRRIPTRAGCVVRFTRPAGRARPSSPRFARDHEAVIQQHERALRALHTFESYIPGVVRRVWHINGTLLDRPPSPFERMFAAESKEDFEDEPA